MSKNLFERRQDPETLSRHLWKNTMKWTFNTRLRRSCAGLLVCRVKRRFGTGFSALDIQTGFSTDPMPEVPPEVDLVHNLSAHNPLTSTLGGSRDLLFNTPRSTLEVLTPRGLPSTQVRLDEPEQDMVDVKCWWWDTRSVQLRQRLMTASAREHQSNMILRNELDTDQRAFSIQM